MSLLVEIHKTYEDFSLDVTLEADDHIMGLLGASGSGKSLTLRCIAGVITPDSGRIILNGRTLFDSAKGVHLSPRIRRVGLMFQSYALFPHMTVEQNIAAGVLDKAQCTAHYIELLRLDGLEKRYPRQLSGGQQQRVALARMMAAEPEILMLDEPFSALDEHLRKEIEPDFRKALDAFAGTVLYVSHSVGEIYRYCDRVAIVRDGSIQEVGAVKRVLEQPQTLAAARLLCCENISRLCNRNHEGATTQWGIPIAQSDAAYAGIFAQEILLSEQPEEGYFAAEVEGIGEHLREARIFARIKGAEQALEICCTKEQAERLESKASREIYLKLPSHKILPLSEQPLVGIAQIRD